MTTSTTISREPQSDAWVQLNLQFRLRPIRNDQELQLALQVTKSLMLRKELDSVESDYLEILTQQIERFEKEEYRLPPVSDGQMLRHLIENSGKTQVEVAVATGIAESTISEVLAERRSLNRKHIAQLSQYFHLNPSVFFVGATE